MDNSLKEFLSDELHSILGFSDKNLEAYIVALAKTSKSRVDLQNKLKDSDLPESEKTTQFLDSLLTRLGRTSSASHAGSNLPSQSSRAAVTEAQLQSQSKSYKLVSM